MGIWTPAPGAVVRSYPIESGVALARGDSVVPSSTSGRVTKGDARQATMNVQRGVLGVCLVGGTGDAGGTVSAQVVVWGAITYSSWSLTVGAPAFMSTSAAGTVTSTVPSGLGNARVWMGPAMSATELVVQPGEPVLL